MQKKFYVAIGAVILTSGILMGVNAGTEPAKVGMDENGNYVIPSAEWKCTANRKPVPSIIICERRDDELGGGGITPYASPSPTPGSGGDH